MLLSSLGEKKTNEAFGEKNKRINCLILNRSISTRCGVQRGSQKERKEKKRKETFTEPSLFTFGEEVAWGPRGHRGFSSTARSEEERKLIHGRGMSSHVGCIARAAPPLPMLRLGMSVFRAVEA